MATIILRQSNVVTSTGGTVKGSPLTNAEVDNNFANLNVAVNFVTYPVGSSGNVLTSNGTVWASTGLPASGLSYVSKSANYTLQNNEGVLSNTALGAFTITLPATPSAGNQVVVADSNGSWSSNNLTIARNGSTIENLAEDIVCDISGASLQLVYTGGTWDVFASTGLTGGNGVTLDGLETLTNKTLTSPSITSATLTGTTQAITAANGTSNAMVATTQFVNNELRDSPEISNATLIGTTQAITAANGTSNAMVATTQFVNNEINDSPTITSATLVTPILGTPISGTLSGCTVDGTDGVGFRNIPIASKSAAYTTVLADSGKAIFHPSTDTNPRTFTIDSNANVAYPLGTAITFINMTSNVATIAIISDTLYLAGTGNTSSRSLAQYGIATAVKMTSNTWIISGNGVT
jgi:hypothetical protein